MLAVICCEGRGSSSGMNEAQPTRAVKESIGVCKRVASMALSRAPTLSAAAFTVSGKTTQNALRRPCRMEFLIVAHTLPMNRRDRSAALWTWRW